MKAIAHVFGYFLAVGLPYTS